MNTNQITITLIGSALLLIYGIRLSAEGMQQAAGGRLRRALKRITHRRPTALLGGLVATAVMQSSTATTVMLISLVSAGLLSLQETIGIILGADIGTTVTVHLIAFNLTEYALLMVGFGIAIMLAARRPVYRYVGQAVLGFGFIFLAIHLMVGAMGPLRSSAVVQELIVGVGDAPLLVAAFAAIFTALVMSSAATLALAVVLAIQGLLPIDVALPVVVGANVGTTAAALISSAGAGAEPRRVALAHALFKVIGFALFWPLLPVLPGLLAATSPDIPRQIANAHTLFNVAIAAICLPLAPQLARLITRLVPEPPGNGDPAQARYLDERVLDTPALALGQATRETLRMADIVQEMYRDTLRVFRENDLTLAEELQDRDDILDRLEEQIKLYLTQVAERSLTPEQSQREVSLLFMVQDLENIGDIVDKNLMELAKKKILGNLEFSAEGVKDIEYLHRLVGENLELVVAAYAARDTELAQKVLRHKANISRIERDLRQAHIRRLHSGIRESFDTSAIHHDVLSNLKRINSHATNIAYVVLGEF